MGTSNFLTCTKRNEKITFGKLQFIVANSSNIEEETVYLAIRPENIEIVDVTVPSENCVPSNIAEVAVEVINFLGAIVRITFFLEGEEMFVDLPEKEFEKISLKRKDKIKLYFPPDAFHVYTEIFKKLI